MITASEIMTKKVIRVYPETLIGEAANTLVNCRISGLPVVDKEDNLAGIVTEKDIMRLLIEEEISELQPVSDIMTKDVKYFSSDASIVDITKCLLSNHFRRIPIVDNGKLVGIVARRELIKLMLQVRAVSDEE